ncbi:MAG: hypothetical protein NBV65_08160 [Burkholderiaceae bacterium]|nr:hypothetical protein [Burkholderiaceae bacterium]
MKVFLYQAGVYTATQHDFIRLPGSIMQNFFVAAADTFKPFRFSFQNPLAALLGGKGSSTAKSAAATARELQRVAREVEKMQPNLAAELRHFAGRS